ncbi:unnamed protein product [Dicrocoelium dendriticum]|nr:unnamed protein product [Dicrocoelium dendriticum]
MSSASDVDTGDEFSALGHPDAGRPVLGSAGERQPHLGSSSIVPTRHRSYDKQLDLTGFDEKMPQNNQNDDSRLPQRTTHNRHSDAVRHQSKKAKKHRTKATHRKGVDAFNDLLPGSETEELERKSGGKRKKKEKRDVRDSRSDKSRESVIRSKDAIDVPGLVEIPTEKADLESIMSGDHKVREATMPEVAPNIATGAQVIIKLPIKVLAILMELNLLWWFMQLFLFVWMTTCVDYQLRVRAPLAEFPGYSPLKMPWLPSQLNMRSRLLAAWLTLAFVYLPLVLCHMSRFYDRQPKQKERKLYKKQHDSKPWYLNSRYTRLQEPMEGQPFNLFVLFVTLILWIFYLFVFLSDAFYPMQHNYWHRTIDKWLYELQRNYFLEFKALAGYIKQEERLQSYHTPDHDNTPVLIMDLLQSMFECCGRTTGYRDWNSPHVYRPKNHTYRKALGFPILNERVYYLLPTLTNNSVPFSCCRWKHQNQPLTHVACDHIKLDDPSTVFNSGCVEPLTRFIQHYWMGIHLIPLLVVILTMHSTKGATGAVG